MTLVTAENFQVDLRGIVDLLQPPPLQQPPRLRPRAAAERGRRDQRPPPRRAGRARLDRPDHGPGDPDRHRHRRRAGARRDPHPARHHRAQLQARRAGVLPPRVHRAVRGRAAGDVPGRRHRRGPQPGRRAPGRALDRRVGRLVRRRRRRGAAVARLPGGGHHGHADRAARRRGVVRRGTVAELVELYGSLLPVPITVDGTSAPSGSRPGTPRARARRRCWRTPRTSWG